MFNPYQRGGIGTVTGDIDRAAHTRKLGRLDKQQEALNTGLTTQDLLFCVWRISSAVFFMHIQKKHKGMIDGKLWFPCFSSVVAVYPSKRFRDMWRKHVWLLVNMMQLSGTMPMKKYIGIKKVTTSVSRNLVVSRFFSLWNYTCQLHHRAKGSMHLSVMRGLWWDSETERQHRWCPPSC